ncbi:MAG: 2-dehydropantoate 2-reductase [Thermoactinomyces sp.]
MKIAVWGGGSLGLLWSARLADKFDRLLLVTRTGRQAEAINRNGIDLTTVDGKQKKLRVRARQVDLVGEDAPFDVILVMVKQIHLGKVFPLLQQVVHPNTLVLFFQNGWGHQSLLEELSCKCRTCLVVTTEGALKHGDYRVSHTGKGISRVGVFPGKQTDVPSGLSELLAKGFFQYDQNILQRVWEKLAINCVVNPLTAWYEIRNGELLNSKYDEEKKSILTEVIHVVSLEENRLSEQKMWKQIHQVCRHTAMNFSSMLQDIKNKRPTEIEFMNGAIVNLGRKHGVETPANRLWVSRIREKESSCYNVKNN